MPQINHDSILQRTQRFLLLGMHGAKWCSTDVCLQNQTLRIISEFTASLPSDTSTNPRFKALLDAVFVALEGLLQAEDVQVQRKTIDQVLVLISRPSCTLASSMQGLVFPLVRLVASGASIVVPAAAAVMRKIIDKSRSTQGGVEESVTRIKDAGVVKALVLNLERVETDPDVFVASAEVLAILLERLPAERMEIGNRMRDLLLEKCLSSNDAVVCASLKLLSSLALCAGVANLIVEDFAMILKVGGNCLRLTHGKHSLLHFLLCLLKFSPELLSRVGQTGIGCIAEVCVAALAYSSLLQHTTTPNADDDDFSLVAVNTLELLLSVPGKHRLELLQSGLVSVLSSSPKETYAARRNSRSHFQSSMWESLGWIGYYCNKTEEALLFGNDSSFETLLDRLCDTFLKTLSRWNQSNTDSRQISHATLLILSSASNKCSSRIRDALEKHHEQHRYDHLLAARLRAASAGTIWLPADVLENRLYILSILCCVSGSGDGLGQIGNLEAVAKIVKKQCKSSGPEWPLCRVSSPIPILRIFKPCCSEEHDRYKGRDGVLFAAVWGIASVLRLEHKSVAAATSYSLRNEVVDLLSALARREDLPQGLRWRASLGLARLGLFGNPSLMGERWGRVLEGGSFSDIRFRFPDGNVLCAHRVVLAARCPVLLSSPADEDGEIRVSSRVGYRTMEIFLRYIYTGIIRGEIDHELPGLKLLAKKCKLQTLLMLLENTSSIWDIVPDCSLGAALGDLRHSDVLLKSTRSNSSELCNVCDSVADHVHAHKALLSSGDDYLGALFRSGMRDSTASVIEIHESKAVISSFVWYLYTSQPPDPRSGCQWQMLDLEHQWGVLEELIDLAALAGEWLHLELEKICVRKVLNRIQVDETAALRPRVLRHAVARRQWELVTAMAESMAPEYQTLRECGALDCLDEDLTEMLRMCYVNSHLEREC